MSKLKFIRVIILAKQVVSWFYDNCIQFKKGLDRFNFGLEQRQWAIPDGLGFIPKDDPKTYHRNFDPTLRGWLPRFGTFRGIIWMGTWRTLHPRLILHEPGTFRVYRGFSPDEP